MADDSYAPSFAKYIGETVATAMEDENPVYEQIAGSSVTTSFNIVATTLAAISPRNIDGVIINPIQVCMMGQYSYTFLYDGDIIAKNQGGTLFGTVLSIGAFDDGGYINKTFADLKAMLTPGAPISQMHDENSNHYDGILMDNVPDDATFIIVDTPKMTA